jgi:HSP20 family protein
MASQAKSKSGNGSQQPDGGQRKGQMTQARSRHMSPFSAPWDRLRTEFDRLFEDFAHRLPAAWGGERQLGWNVDMQESENAVVVRADAPGFEPDDFDIEVRGDNLELCACQSEEKTEDEEGYHWQRRELYRSIPLPAGVDTEKIDAEYRNGVLTVKLPKSEEMTKRKIQVHG